MRHAALIGTTASGKSQVALDLARLDPSWELVSIDSMQVYRGMDIGTAKPSPAEQAETPHHLIDLVDPDSGFTVVDFRAAYDAVLAGIEARGKRALLVGGTGLYLRAVVDRLQFPGTFPEVMEELRSGDNDPAGLHRRLAELDPLAASRMEPTNARRVLRALEVTIGSGQPFSSFGPGMQDYPDVDMILVGLRLPAQAVRHRIEERYRRQMDCGFLEEVRGLASRPDGLSRSAAQALGYRELLGHLRGDATLAESLELAIRRTKRFARRQRAWFHRDPRIEWFEVDEPGNAVALLAKRLEDS